MKRLVLLTAVLFTAVSCTKFGKNITVKGKVLNPITGEGYEGITVQLIRHKHFQYEGGYRELKHTTTNQNGEFEISAYYGGKVWVQAQSPAEYYQLGWLYEKEDKYYYMKTVDKGKVMNIDCHLVPYGNYQLKINNVNCGGGADTLIINQTNQIGTFLGVDWVITGCNGYVTALEKVPMGTVHTKYTVIRNGVSNTYTVDFEVKPNQDNIQEINY